jgi:hypothetical protein
MSTIRVALMLEQGSPFEVVLRDHLRHNIYPPVPDMEDVAREAIDFVDCGEGDQYVRLPNGAGVPASEVVDGLHLLPFVEHRQQNA